ncbi:MAG: carbohydrate binding domain-containing protein [Verrucomicrobiota bacterium]
MSYRLVRKYSSKLRALALACLLSGWDATAQNLATNPGFETGNTSGWFQFGSPTIAAQNSVVHSGTYAASVTGRTQTYMGIAQSFAGAMTSGQTYTISAWLRLASGSSQTMQLTMQKADGAGTTYTPIASGSVNTSGWTQLSGQYTFTYSGSLTTLTLYAEMPSSSSNSYYIDDVVVQLNGISTNGACVVDWTNQFQRIDGFGASSAWDGSWNAGQADLYFSTNSGSANTFDGKTHFTFNGAGLSLLRNHISPANSTLANATPTTVETAIMQMAQARGARVWSAPWTPPAGFKSTNDIYDSGVATGGGINGGSFRGSGGNLTNVNYASQLANYVASMKTSYGVNIYALSIQNEPDANVTSYEACQWSAAQIHDFTTNLSAALAAKGYGSTKIMLPESQNWTDPRGLASPTLADPNTLAAVSIIGNHNYVADNATGDTSIPSAIPTSGKARWETEVAQLGSPFDGSITNGLYWAGRVHLFMTAAQANAFHFWWLVPYGSSNEGLVDTNGYPAKRLFTIGQFSRFVRPNYYRIGVPTNSSSAWISAYKDPVSGMFAIVALNNSYSTVTQTFNLSNISGVTSVTPWITSDTMSISNQTPVALSGSSFTYNLPALSVITFVGQGTPTPVTTLTLASGANPSTYGNGVTFTASVKTNGIAVDGVAGELVSFYNGASLLGTSALNSGGEAAYTTTATQLGAGTKSITAIYPGDTSFTGSTNSPALSQVINPATLTYTANATNMVFGAPVPALNGSVTGFVSGENQASATTGTPLFTTPATSTSPAGSYAINGSGLSAANYIFAQAAGNAAALTVLPLQVPGITLAGMTGGIQLSSSGQPGQTFQLLTSTDLALPLAQWTVLTNGTYDAGAFSFVDTNTNSPRQFYLITSP